jgi:hypothetical protein
MQYRGASPDHKFRNHALEKQTVALQAEFEALMGQKKTATLPDMAQDSFYQEMMHDRYAGHKKHRSPTKRLMDQKDAACEIKSVINAQLSGNRY